MLEHPIYLQIPTDSHNPHFTNHSAAEVVISTLINIQQRGWLRLHGFVLLPDSLDMVTSLIRQGVSGVVGQIESETIPMLSVLMPKNGIFWAQAHNYAVLETKLAFDARLKILHLSPVARGLVDKADRYTYSSANPRYQTHVAPYAGFMSLGHMELDNDEDDTTIIQPQEIDN